MRIIGVLLGMAMAAGMISPALAQKQKNAPPVTLKPAGAWEIDYAKDSCAVLRKYGAGAEQIEMVFITLPRSSGATLAFITSAAKGPGSKEPNFGRARLILPDGMSFSEDFASAPLGDLPRRFVYIRLDQEQLDRVILSNRIEVDAGRAFRMAIEPGRTAAAFKALEPCHADLLKSWNLDPEILSTAVNRAAPAGSPQRWVNNDDYPREALHKREQGTSTFRLTIAADGSISECVMLTGSGSKLLDDTACRLLRERAKFKPARDVAGNPVRDLWISRFRWELPF